MDSGEARIVGPGANSIGTAGVQFGLGGRIAALVIVFALLAEIAISAPTIANFRNAWLRDRLAAANTAALVFAAAPADMVPEDLARSILSSVGAHLIVLKTKETRRLLAASDMPPKIDEAFDLRTAGLMESITAAFRCLFAPEGRILNLIGPAPMGAEYIEIAIDEAPLRKAMTDYSVTMLLLTLMISGAAAGLALFALRRMVLAPVRRLTDSITAFGAEPGNATLIIEPSGASHEIGVAERALATMQLSLLRELSRAKHLAALGLAVAKINHDLRNILTSAQLLSDRMAALSDPLGRSLAPRLVATLDRAISYCQSTLNYGKAAERDPVFARLALAPLIDEVMATLTPRGEGVTRLINEAPRDVEIRAAQEHLFRILLTNIRNAVDALDSAGPRPGRGAIVRVRAQRENGGVLVEIADSGPGVPARARARLFEAFQGGARPGGVGLGLAIASDLVRTHGGELSLSDEPAPELGGALFRIVLPASGARGHNGNSRSP